jgi:hypothetical protein
MVLEDNSDRRRHEVDTLNIALERTRDINKHVQETRRLEAELRKLEVEMREIELEKLRLAVLCEANVSDRSGVVDLMNKIRRVPAPDKPWYVHAKELLVAGIPLFLDLVAVAVLAKILSIMLGY